MSSKEQQITVTFPDGGVASKAVRHGVAVVVQIHDSPVRYSWSKSAVTALQTANDPENRGYRRVLLNVIAYPHKVIADVPAHVFAYRPDDVGVKPWARKNW
jgi:hypothetical protein